MPELILRKTLRSLEATDSESDEVLKGIPYGDCVLVTIRRPRNIRFHRKFFGLLNAVFENQSTYRRLEHLLIAVKLKVGHVNVIRIRLDGEVVLIPKSISFAKMDELEFGRFYAAAVEALRELLPDMRFLSEHTLEELQAMIEDYID